MRSTPELLCTLIGPVNPLLSFVRTSVPVPSLVKDDPVLPVKWPEMVRSAPKLTVKNWSTPAGAPSTTSKAIAFPVAAVLTLIDPLPGTPPPRVIAVPDRVYPLPDKLIELKTAPTRLLTLEGRAAAVGNTKLSVGIPVGAIPPAQFAAVLQLLSPPPPLQVNVAGVSRASSDSTD